jgi:hypothetical protein
LEDLVSLAISWGSFIFFATLIIPSFIPSFLPFCIDVDYIGAVVSVCF